MHLILAGAFLRIVVTASVVFVVLFAGCSGDSGNRSKNSSSQQTVTEQRSTPSSGMADTPSQFSGKSLRSAALQGGIATVKKAMEQGVDVNASDREGRTALMLASYNGHTEVVKYLLENGADLTSENAQGRTALIFAASGPYPGTVELLLESGADPNTTDSGEGWSALMFAAAGGHDQVVETLLNHGADPSLQDNDGDRAIDFARENNHSKVMSRLGEAQN